MKNSQLVIWMEQKNSKQNNEINQMSIEKAEQDKINTVSNKIPANLISMVRRDLTIGSITVSAFMDAQGLYYIHMSQTAKLVGKKGSEVESFIVQNVVKSSTANLNVKDVTSLFRQGLIPTAEGDCSISVVCDSGRVFRVIPIKAVVDFAWFQMDKGNTQARDLVYIFSQESLEIRCESAFIGVSPNVVSIIQKNDQWIACRDISKSVHATFQNTCMFLKHPVAHTHNRMTKNLFGQTARQAIANNILVGNDPSVGLDYQKEGEKLIVLADMKIKFTSYKKGTWQDKVDRAYSQLK